MSVQYICHKPEELVNIASKLSGYLQQYSVFAFYGKMGVGKTSLIKAICKELGVDDEVVSPTFSIINEYRTGARKTGEEKPDTVYHFDFYRINNLSEAVDTGCEEYFYSGNYCFIEWPEKIETLIPRHYVEVKIEEDNNNPKGKRTITISQS